MVMKKYILLLTCLLSFGISMAQQETSHKSLTRIEGKDFCWGLNYTQDGLLYSVYDGNKGKDQYLWSYDYSVSLDGFPFIIQSGYFNPGEEFHIYYEDTFFRESKLNSDGLISKDDNGNHFMWSTGEKFEYEYADGRMMKITGNEGLVAELLWQEGNLTQIKFLENEEEVGTISCSYTNMEAKGICQALNSPLFLLLDYYQIKPLGALLHGYYGKLCQNLISEMTISFNDKFIKEHDRSMGTIVGSYYPIVEKKNRVYHYETATDGSVAKITINEGENIEEISMVYEANITSIRLPKAQSGSKNSYYDLQGRAVNSPTKGIYINNGRKAIVK